MAIRCFPDLTRRAFLLFISHATRQANKEIVGRGAGRQRIARESSHQEIDGEHLLLALLGQAESPVPELLARIGVPPAKLQPDLEKELARRHKIQGGGDPYAGRDLQKALDAAHQCGFRAADQWRDYLPVEVLVPVRVSVAFRVFLPVAVQAIQPY